MAVLVVLGAVMGGGCAHQQALEEVGAGEEPRGSLAEVQAEHSRLTDRTGEVEEHDTQLSAETRDPGALPANADRARPADLDAPASPRAR